MSTPSRKRRSTKGKKVRIDLRRNRSKPRRVSDWTRQAREAEEHDVPAHKSERVIAKGDMSRRRTIIVHEENDASKEGPARGTVVAMRGPYADVHDGKRVWPCTVRRLLRTRLIEERNPITVGDRVRFLVGSTGEGVEEEGVIEGVEDRRGQLCRRVGRRTHTIVANVDQALIISSADEPTPKPNLIDRYIVASLAGDITPVICMNKIDLDPEGSAATLLERYAQLGYTTLLTSVVSGEGIASLRDILKDKASVVAGQSGVGKSSMLNSVQPGLKLRTGDIIEQLKKGRHTTSTARMLRLDVGGYVVDTPGIRSFDVSMVERHEFEMYFVDLARHVPDCRFPDCTHTHESDCAVKLAVKRGELHPDRYESYVRLFEESAQES